jgi:hypothetical protein
MIAVPSVLTIVNREMIIALAADRLLAMFQGLLTGEDLPPSSLSDWG